MRNNSTFVYFVNSYKSVETYSPQESDSGFKIQGAQEFNAAPSENTINNILGFARSYEVMESKNTGFVEMILN